MTLYHFLYPCIERSGAYNLWPVHLFVYLSFYVCLSAKTLTLAISIEWYVVGLSYFIRVPCDKTFLLVPWILISWPWPWILTYFLRTLTLAICFEWQVIRLSYFTCVFLVARPFHWYLIFYPLTLHFVDDDHLWNLPLCLKSHLVWYKNWFW
jgi:hypothetical protein